MSFKINQKLKFSYFCNVFIISSIFFAGLFLLPETAYLAGIDSIDIINLTNQERLNNNLEKLDFNPKLKKAAYAKAKFLLNNQIFTHNTSEKKFSDWIKNVDYEYSFVGENLAINFTENEEVVRAWMESKGHRENILSEDYTEIGVSVLEGEYDGHSTYLIVQIFGTPRNEKKVLQANSSPFLASSTTITNVDNNINIDNFNPTTITFTQDNKATTQDLLTILMSIIIASLLSYLYTLILSYIIKKFKKDSFGKDLSHHH
ncbi:CAP domain-containing protein [bacterium]|nr:CAP domain-containing protein [bacterium]